MRTVVEVETDEGLIGLGEMGGGEYAEIIFRAMKSYLVGHDTTRLEEMLLAAVGAARWQSVEAACDASINVVGRVTPDERRSHAYKGIYQHYHALYPTLQETFNRLAEIS